MSGENETGSILSHVESVIMAAVLAGQRTSRGIYDALPETSRNRLAFTTIATYLMRMVQKGYLRRVPTEGREYEYYPILTIDKIVEQALQRANEAGAKGSEVLRGFAGSKSWDKDIREQLRILAKQLEEIGQ